MLINAKPAQVEQPLEGIKILDKGQGLPQGKPFSQLFASMMNQPGKQVANSGNVSKDQVVSSVEDVAGSVIDVSTLLENKAISSSQVDSVDPSEAFPATQLDTTNLEMSNNGENSADLPGLVNSNIDAASEFTAGNNTEIDLQSVSDSVDMVNDGEISTAYPAGDTLDNPILSQSQEFGYGVSDASIDGSVNNVANITMPPAEAQEMVDKSVDDTTPTGSIQVNNLTAAGPQVVNQQSGGQQSTRQTNTPMHWGASNSDGSQTSGFTQSGQSGSQFNGQQSSHSGTQSNAQPYMANAIQPSQFQEKRAQNIEQQMAVKATDEIIVKADSKEGLLTIDGLSGDKKTFLPPGMQSIPVPVKSPQWGQAFGQRVVYMANNKLQQAQITLNPEKLGPVQVKLHIDKDQQVHVTMNAQHLTTREAMENAIPRLREMLEQAGIDLASVDVGEQSNFANNSDGESGSEKDANSSMMSADSDGVEQSLTKTTIMSDNIVDFYA